MSEIIEPKWKRPESAERRVWNTFKARNIDSDELVEYRIEDLPESRFQDVIDLMLPNFLRDEPLCEAYGKTIYLLKFCIFLIIGNPFSKLWTKFETKSSALLDSKEALEDFHFIWRSVLSQKVALVCFREGSDEIVGVNMNCVLEKDDHFMEETAKRVSQTWHTE